MKSLYFSLFVLLFNSTIFSQLEEIDFIYPPEQEKSNASIANPKQVLVVCQRNNAYSLSIANYYVSINNIPTENLVKDGEHFGIQIEQSVTYQTGTVILTQGGEVIENAGSCVGSTTQLCDDIAWQYYKEYIENPIKNYMNTTVNSDGDTLKNIIRYIVLIKGIPHKIRSGHTIVTGGMAHSKRINVSVDALLCLMNNTQDILTLYNAGSGIFLADDPAGSNPYFNVDKEFTMDYRFKTNHFTSANGWELNYLVSRLDGVTYEDVYGLIDRSANTDKSGNGNWIIDNHLAGWNHYIANTKSQLEKLGFNIMYDNSSSAITSSQFPVMGYVSGGFNAGMDSTYIRDDLTFQYLNGAVFTTYESFNGWTMDPQFRNWHGLTSEFVSNRPDLQVGTGGTGNAWEPFAGGVCEPSIFFPAYACGYGLVDAAYMGMKFLGWQNIVIGDPLAHIANYPVIHVSQADTAITDESFIGKIAVSDDKILTIQGDSFSLKRNAFLEVKGVLNLEVNSFQTKDMSRFTADEITISPNTQYVISDYSQASFENLSLNTDAVFIAEKSGTVIIRDLYISENAVFTVKNNAKLRITGNLTLEHGASLILMDNSVITFKNLHYNNFDGITIGHKVSIVVEEILMLEANTVLTLTDTMHLEAKNVVLQEGAIFNVSGNSEFKVREAGTFVMNDASQLKAESLAVCVIRGKSEIKFNALIHGYGNSKIIIAHIDLASGQIVTMFDNSRLILNNGTVRPGAVMNFRDASLMEIGSDSSFVFAGKPDSLIYINMHYNAPNISTNFSVMEDGNQIFNHCVITNGSFTDQITSSENSAPGNMRFENVNFNQTEGYHSPIINLSNRLDIDFSLLNCDINTNTGDAIKLSGAGTVFIQQTGFISQSGSEYAINLENCQTVYLSNNSINNFTVGISLANIASDVILTGNVIGDVDLGISLNNTGYPFLIENILSSNRQNSSAGILSVSSHGSYRLNSISGFSIGIDLGGSSPSLAQNHIFNNSVHGLYVGFGSIPDLSASFSAGQTEYIQYPLSGFNSIYDNGQISDELMQSEIALNSYDQEADLMIYDGCNNIYDDRGLDTEHRLLIDGYASWDIKATGNYWGNHPFYGHDPSNRFGDSIQILADPYHLEPCYYDQGQQFVIVFTSNGTAIDTIYSAGLFEELDITQALFAEVNEKYYMLDFIGARNLLEQAIENLPVSRAVLPAFIQLLSLYKYYFRIDELFSSFETLLENRLQFAGDPVVESVLKNLKYQCMVERGDFNSARSGYEYIIQTNPNSDKAFYSELNLLAIESAIDTSGGFHKMSFAKSDIVSLLKDKYKGVYVSKSIITIPDNFELLQNYPNPFNPVSKIEFALPKQSDITLKVFDILGKEVATLASGSYSAGRYTVPFDGTSHASGIYFCEMKAGAYKSIIKMILIK